MNSEQVPYYLHDLGRDELGEIEKVFKGPILTTGEVVSRFEKEFSEYLGIPNVIAVTSCTAAMHLSLLALDVGPGDEVITTPLTFVATAQAICYTGAKPVFVDVDPVTGNLDVEKILDAVTDNTAAVLPVHLYGQMCDIGKLVETLNREDIAIIEDAAHCLEGRLNGKSPGALSDAACFSFFATKNITCGEGGAVSVRSDALAKRIRLLRNHAMNKSSADRFKDGYSHYDTEILGWKYNMSNIEAAILLPQMKKIEQRRILRERLANYYRETIVKEMPEIGFPGQLPNSVHANHLFTIWAPDEFTRDLWMRQLRDLGIPTMVNYRPVHLQTYIKNTFGYREKDFPVSENIGGRTLSLPFFPSMTMEQAKMVMDKLFEVYSIWKKSNQVLS